MSAGYYTRRMLGAPEASYEAVLGGASERPDLEEQRLPTPVTAHGVTDSRMDSVREHEQYRERRHGELPHLSQEIRALAATPLGRVGVIPWTSLQALGRGAHRGREEISKDALRVAMNPPAPVAPVAEATPQAPPEAAPAEAAPEGSPLEATPQAPPAEAEDPALAALDALLGEKP